MEAEYLRAKVGDALAEGMAETAMARPADPVEYLGLWLQKYCDNIEAARVQKQIQQQYQAEEEDQLRLAELKKIKEEQEQSLLARDAAELEEMNGIVTSEPSQPKLEDSVLEFLKTKTGASAAYVGVKDVLKELTPGAEGEEPTESVKDIVKYCAATSNNKFLIGKQLVKNPDPEAKKEQGALTFDIFEKVEDIPAPTEEVPEPAPPEEGWPLKWKAPYVQVEECVREPLIKYFRTPKLGGYLAVPWEYNYEVDTMNEGDGPDLVEGECPAFPEYTMTTNTRQGCLGLDTLGTDGQFKKSDCEVAIDWTAKLAQGLGRIAQETIEGERATRQGYKERNIEQWGDINAARVAVAEDLTALLEDSKTAAAEARAADMPTPPAEGEEGYGEEQTVPEEAETDMALREAGVKCKRFKELIEEKKEMVLTLNDRTDLASRHWQVLQAILLFLKTAPADCDSWAKCQAYVASDAFWTSLAECDVSVARDMLMVQSTEAVKTAIEGVDLKNVERTHAPISLLVDWLNAALELQAAATAVRKAKKEAADAAGEPYEEQIEDIITDKPVEEAEAE